MKSIVLLSIFVLQGCWMDVLSLYKPTSDQPTYQPQEKVVLLVGDSLSANGTTAYHIKRNLGTSWEMVGSKWSFDQTIRHESHSGKGYNWLANDPESPMVDIPTYISTLSKPPTDVVFFLGINDMYSSQNEFNVQPEAQKMLTSADALFRAWLTALPNIKIWMTTFPQANARNSAFINNYGSAMSITKWTLIWTQINFYIKRYDPDVIRIDNLLDPIADYPETNALHPLASGSAKIGVEIADRIRRTH